MCNFVTFVTFASLFLRSKYSGKNVIFLFFCTKICITLFLHNIFALDMKITASGGSPVCTRI